jgi:hypothetical protein
MKAIQSMIALAAIAIGMSVPVSAATTDPEVIIYRFPGVRDDGNADNTGIATVFSCTNFSGVQETLRFVTRSAIGTLLTNVPLQAVHLQTLTMATHPAVAYPSSSLGTGPVVGTTAIAATSTNIICTAMVLDAANSKPDGVALRGIRFSPVPGSQE